MSADNFVAVVYGKRHADDDKERFLLFVVGDSGWSDRFPGGNPTPKEMLDYCLECWGHYAKQWPTEEWFWWKIPAEDTLDDAWKRAGEMVHDDEIEYGAAAFLEEGVP